MSFWKQRSSFKDEQRAEWARLAAAQQAWEEEQRRNHTEMARYWELQTRFISVTLAKFSYLN